MKRLLISLALLLAGSAHAWEYQRNAEPLPLPPGYQKPGAGTSISRFDRKPRPPYWDSAGRCLVIECCMPPICRNGVSHFYTFVYTISADGKSMTRTKRMWNSHKTDADPTAVTSTMTSDTPYHFNTKHGSYSIRVDEQGCITSIEQHKATAKQLVYPAKKAPAIVHDVF